MSAEISSALICKTISSNMYGSLQMRQKGAVHIRTDCLTDECGRNFRGQRMEERTTACLHYACLDAVSYDAARTLIRRRSFIHRRDRVPKSTVARHVYFLGETGYGPALVHRCAPGRTRSPHPPHGSFVDRSDARNEPCRSPKCKRAHLFDR